MKCCSLFLILQAGVQLTSKSMFKDRLDGYQTLRLLAEVRRRLDEAKLTKESQLPEPRLTLNVANTSVRGSTGPSVCWIDSKNGETLDQGTEQQAYLSQQGERKALGKRLEEGCDDQTAHEDLQGSDGNEGPPGQRSAIGRACSRNWSELCRKADRSRKREQP
jgi:hypothetical protein